MYGKTVAAVAKFKKIERCSGFAPVAEKWNGHLLGLHRTNRQFVVQSFFSVSLQRGVSESLWRIAGTLTPTILGTT